MKNRNGTISNGYFGSPDHIDDIMIADNGRIADAFATDLGHWVYCRHRIGSNIRTIGMRIRRWWLS
jgi:hypothetical protein